MRKLSKDFWGLFLLQFLLITKNHRKKTWYVFDNIEIMTYYFFLSPLYI